MSALPTAAEPMTAPELLAHELAPVALHDGERRLLAALVSGEMAPSYVTEIRVAQMTEQIRTYAERRAGGDVPTVEALINDHRLEGALRVTDATIERFERYLADLDEPTLEPGSTAEEQLAAYHAMRAPSTGGEAVTAAHLLGLPLEAIEAIRRDWGTPSLDRRDVAPLPPLQSVGALAAWRRELSAGRRDQATLDDLWRAACSEQSAWNAEALGLHESARRDMGRAAELLGVKPVAPAERARERPSPRRPALSGLDRIALARARTQRNP